MSLLFDENLPSQLVLALSDLYPGSSHVKQVGLLSAGDPEIWNYAKKHRLAIVTKDADFVERSVIERDSPKIIWLRLGNCANEILEATLRDEYDKISLFLSDETAVRHLINRKPRLRLL